MMSLDFSWRDSDLKGKVQISQFMTLGPHLSGG